FLRTCSNPNARPQVESSKEIFQRSLLELSSWDWKGAQLVVEHCDALRASHAPAKGFLELEEELEATMATPAVGQSINWGRSCFETRDPDTPVAHCATVAKRGRLSGIFLSGCSAEDPVYGNWQDNHVPFSTTPGASSSLMTPEAALRLLRAARATQGLNFVGL